MTNQQLINTDRWSLNGICLNTIFKVNDFDVFHHMGENPYYQISVGGFVIVDCGGAILFSNIQMSADDGDVNEVSRLQSLFLPDSLHWVKAENFYYGDREILIYNPETKLVVHGDYDAINSFFPVKVSTNRAPELGEFYCAGDIFAEGEGTFKGFKQ